MVTILCIIVIATGMYAGYRRGIVLEGVYAVGYMLSFFMASQKYQVIGDKIELFIPYPAPTRTTKLLFFDQKLLFDLDKGFYAALGFVIILFVGYLLTRFVGMLCYGLTFKSVFRKNNQLLGGILNGVLTYIGLVIALYMLSMIPLDRLQTALHNSTLARMMIEHTPMLSAQLYEWWIQKIIV